MKIGFGFVCFFAVLAFACENRQSAPTIHDAAEKAQGGTTGDSTHTTFKITISTTEPGSEGGSGQGGGDATNLSDDSGSSGSTTVRTNGSTSGTGGTTTTSETDVGGNSDNGTGGSNGQSGGVTSITPCNGNWTPLPPIFAGAPPDKYGLEQQYFEGGMSGYAYGAYYDATDSARNGLIAEIDATTQTLAQIHEPSELGVTSYRKVIVFPNGDVAALGMALPDNSLTILVSGPTTWQVATQFTGYPQDMCGSGLDDLYILSFKSPQTVLTHVSSANPWTIAVNGGPNILACIDGHVLFTTEDISGNPAGTPGFYDAIGGVLTSLPLPVQGIRIRGIIGHDINHLYMSYTTGWFNGYGYSYNTLMNYFVDNVPTTSSEPLAFLPVNLQFMGTAIASTTGSMSKQPTVLVLDANLVTQATWSLVGQLDNVRGLWQAEDKLYAAGNLDGHDQLVVCKL